MAEKSGPFLPFRWIVPADLALHYTSTFFVQSTGSELFLRMFEVKPPLIGEAEPEAVGIEGRSVDARCVGQFVMSLDRARELLALLQKYVEPGPDEDGGA